MRRLNTTPPRVSIKRRRRRTRCALDPRRPRGSRIRCARKNTEKRRVRLNAEKTTRSARRKSAFYCRRRKQHKKKNRSARRFPARVFDPRPPDSGDEKAVPGGRREGAIPPCVLCASRSVSTAAAAAAAIVRFSARGN